MISKYKKTLFLTMAAILLLLLGACPETTEETPPPNDTSPFQAPETLDAGHQKPASNMTDAGTNSAGTVRDSGAAITPIQDSGTTTTPNIVNDAGPLPPCEMPSLDGGLTDAGMPQDTDNDGAPDYCDAYPEHHNDDIQFLTALITNSELSLNPLQLGSQTWNTNRLTHLYCDDADLSGPLPPSIVRVSKLVNLVLSNNSLTGEIPLGMATLTQLNQLELGFNLLTGPLPAELGEITTLTFLSVSDNALVGTLPETLSNLSALHTLRVDQNNFTGPIPEDYVNLSSLEFLWVHGNELTGVIPGGLCELENIVTLIFGANEFCPPYPTCTAVDLGPQNTNNCDDAD